MRCCCRVADSAPSIRPGGSSLANLNEEDYVKIGRSVRKLRDEYLEKYRAQGGKAGKADKAERADKAGKAGKGKSGK